jgi:hypothetical protein
MMNKIDTIHRIVELIQRGDENPSLDWINTEYEEAINLALQLEAEGLLLERETAFFIDQCNIIRVQVFDDLEEKGVL